MEMIVQEFMDKAVAEDVEAQIVNTDVQTLQQVTTIQMGLDFISQQTAAGHIAQYNWIVEMPKGDDISIRLETSVINLPLENAKTISKIMQLEETAELNVYLIAESPDMNKSGLRIDRLASVTAVQDDPDGVAHSASNWVNEKLDHITEVREQPEDDE